LEQKQQRHAALPGWRASGLQDKTGFVSWLLAMQKAKANATRLVWARLHTSLILDVDLTELERQEHYEY
jgi:hypothetical protein